jgi:hypothetical protein
VAGQTNTPVVAIVGQAWVIEPQCVDQDLATNLALALFKPRPRSPESIRVGGWERLNDECSVVARGVDRHPTSWTRRHHSCQLTGPVAGNRAS